MLVSISIIFSSEAIFGYFFVKKAYYYRLWKVSNNFENVKLLMDQ